MSPRFVTDLQVAKLEEPGGLGRARWRLLADLVYDSAVIGRLIVPAGYETDFASVPRLPVVFTLTGDTAHASAVVHDYLVDLLPWSDAALVFREAMAAEGVPSWRRWPMYWAVLMSGAPHQRTEEAP